VHFLTYVLQVEKMYDIATSAIRVARPKEDMLSRSQSQPSHGPFACHQDSFEPCSPPTTEEGRVYESATYDCQHDKVTTSPAISVSDFANRFLVTFATFRGGKHPYFKPYMRLICELDLP
jgi:hypothetical protein